MSIHIEFDPAGTHATIIFALSQDNERQTSVVGSFNNWNPDRNPLLPKEDGTCSATVTVDAIVANPSGGDVGTGVQLPAKVDVS